MRAPNTAHVQCYTGTMLTAVRAPLRTTRAALLLLGVSSAACVALLSPVLAPEHGDIAHEAFARLCHQRVDRSFVIDGHALAVCHRCTGIYAGLVLGSLLALVGVRVPPSDRRTWLVALGPLVFQAGLCTVVPFVRPHLDFVWLRVATGLGFGAISAIALTRAFAMAWASLSDTATA